MKRQWVVLLVAVLIGVFTVQAASADILKFDMGRSDRPKVMNGFTAVTVKDDYSDDKGYGWVGATGEAVAGWLEERSPMAGCLRSQAPDDLSADYVGGGGAFGVKVPNGKYVVWMMVGDWGAYEFYPRGKYTVLAEGNVIGELDHSTWAKFKDTFFRHRDDLYVHGQDLFEKYVEPRFRIYTAEVDVNDGRLDLQVRKDEGPGSYVGALNGVVVFPVAEKAEGEKALAELKAARKAQFDKQFPQVDTYENYIGDMLKEESDRGFGTWSVPAGEDIGIGARRDRRRTENEKLSAMCSRGEMEPVVVCVRPLTNNPGKFTCTVGPLKGNLGDVLPAGALSIRVVKPWEMIVRASQEQVAKAAKQNLRVNVESRIIAAEPYFLVERNWFEGQPRISRAFWLTVKMPKTAPSVTYKTDVVISGNGKEFVMPLTVTALPFVLPRSKFAVSVNYSAPSHPDWFADSKGLYWDIVEKDMQLQYDYGMTTVGILGSFVMPKNPGDENRWEKFIHLYQKIGFEQILVQGATMSRFKQMPKELGTPLDKAWQDAYVKEFRDLEAVAKKYNQKVIYSIGDETTNDGGEGRIIEVGKVAKARMDDLELMSDINGYRELMGLAPNIDACGFNNGWHGSYGTNRQNHMLMTRDIIERVKSLGSDPWFINGGKGRYPYGIWFWKTTKWGQKGKIEWMYDAASADLYNPFDGTSINDFGSLVLPDQVCTIQWELCREGVDDLRYLEQLDALIEKHRDAADPFMKGVLERAIYVRDFWHDCVADRFTSTGNPDGSGDYAGKAWPSSRLDAMRTEVAKMICMFNGYIVPGVYEDQVICDGDTGYQPEKQLGGLAKWVEDAHATQGTHCFQLTFKGGKGYADKWGRPPEKDWRGYRFLKLDIVNGENRVVNINLNLRDQLAANTGAFNVTNSRKFACAPGKNSFVIPLVGLKGNDGKYTLDLSCLFSYYFTTEGDQDVTVYVDNMRLTPR